MASISDPSTADERCRKRQREPEEPPTDKVEQGKSELEERRLRVYCSGHSLPLSVTLVTEVSAPGLGRHGLAGHLWPAGKLLAELLLRPLPLGQELALLLSQSARILDTFLDFDNQGVHVRSDERLHARV
ncbi:rab13 [Symbiodinium sp. CCMP2592]|nr:rab13 [Symbiodinium sp. CCMP2592]